MTTNTHNNGKSFVVANSPRKAVELRGEREREREGQTARQPASQPASKPASQPARQPGSQAARQTDSETDRAREREREMRHEGRLSTSKYPDHLYRTLAQTCLQHRIRLFSIDGP